jgi:hypothetical protein
MRQGTAIIACCVRALLSCHRLLSYVNEEFFFSADQLPDALGKVCMHHHARVTRSMMSRQRLARSACMCHAHFCWVERGCCPLLREASASRYSTPSLQDVCERLAAHAAAVAAWQRALQQSALSREADDSAPENSSNVAQRRVPRQAKQRLQGGEEAAPAAVVEQAREAAVRTTFGLLRVLKVRRIDAPCVTLCGCLG